MPVRLPSLPLRGWTAVTGTALAILFGVLLVREANPQWRRHQRRFLQVQRQVAERAVADAEKSLGQPEVRARLAEAEKRLEDARRAERVRQGSGELHRARQRLEDAERQSAGARDALQRTRAQYQAAERGFLLAKTDAARARWRPGLDRLRVEVERLAVDRDRKTAIRDQAAQFLQSLTAEVASALQALTQIREPLERARADLKAASSQSARIEQILVDPLNRVDRCTSCHVASTHQGIETMPELRSHVGRYVVDHAPERFGCTICHGGQGRATRLPAAHGRVAFWRGPLLDRDLMGGRCAVCHRGATVPGEPYAGGGRRLFQEFGCQGCHDVEGLPSARVGPSLADIGSKVGPTWLAIWLRAPKAYLPKTRMPNFRLSDKEIADLSAFLLSLRRADAPEARDSRFAAMPGAGKRGETLFKESRCITCHAINRRGGTLGPDLGRVASKGREAWLLEFLQDPPRVLPGTRMPRYRFSAAEAADLVAYVSQELRDFDDQAWPPPPAAPGNVEEGRRLVRKYGCFGCHAIPTFEQVGKVGAELTGYADKEVDRLDFGLRRDVPRTWRAWSDTKLRDPRGYRDDLKMPDFQLTDHERFSLLTYLASLSEEKPPPEYLRELPPAVPYQPEGRFGELAGELNCLVCHAIRGQGGSLAPDLTREGSRVRGEWLRRFLDRPNTIRLFLEERMPRFRLSRGDIEVLATYIENVLVDPNVPKTVLAPSEITLDLVRQGRDLYYQTYACDSCHQIGASGGAIGPDLTLAAERLTEGWIYAWLRDSRSLEPEAREPAYDLPDGEARAITAFLLTLKGQTLYRAARD